MNIGEEVIVHLRKDLEAAVGRKMVVPRDFEKLSERVFQSVHMKISPTTLKRLWGYLKDGTMPRESTLDILSQFLGHEDWNAYCSAVCPDFTVQDEPNDAESHDGEAETKSDEGGRRRRVVPAVLTVVVLLAVVIGVAVLFNGKNKVGETALSQADTNKTVLRIGDRFDSYDAYLRLFGIRDAGEYPYFQPLKNHQNIVVWGPEFHNVEWHNDGNPDSLMPTITEWWAPKDANPDLVTAVNAEHYYAGKRLNDIRLTFMRNLKDSGFVFLGAYRFSVSQSDTTHIVFERVAEECDLNDLDKLLKLRN